MESTEKTIKENEDEKTFLIKKTRSSEMFNIFKKKTEISTNPIFYTTGYVGDAPPPVPLNGIASTTRTTSSVAELMKHLSDDAPSMNGNLVAVKLKNSRDSNLYWKGMEGEKPTFQWQPRGESENNNCARLLIFAIPNERNVAALFDAAGEKNVGMPKIKISGTSEFQRLAAAEAVSRGIELETENLDEGAREIYENASKNKTNRPAP